VKSAETVWLSIAKGKVLPALGSSKQRKLDAPFCITTVNSLLESQTDPTSSAWLLASRSNGFGEWLNALPLASIGLKLDNAFISAAVLCG
jgi:hypothetical protein